MKKPKSEVGYSVGHKDSHCGPSFKLDKSYCRSFVGGDNKTIDGTCKKVAGPIKRHYWCELFKKVE